MEVRKITYLTVLLATALTLSNFELAKAKNCKKLDGKELLEGCTVLKGLTIKSERGTIVNETNCDVLLPKKVFSKEPHLTFKEADKDKFYTVLCIDPDAPKHDPGYFFLHMIKSNIAGSDLTKGCTCAEKTIKPYVGPNPPAGKRDHRYMFLIYEQENKNLNSAPQERSQFHLTKWLSNQELCGPVAGVQFRARFDV